MKKFFVTLMGSATLLSAQAQLFSPEAFTGAAFGSWIGAIAGSDCHGLSGEGAAIGAGVGLLVGALAGEARRSEYEVVEPVYVPATTVSLGYGYSSGASSAYVYYSPNYYTAPGYYYRPTQPNYAVNGTLLGAASGALIGSGYCEPGKGAAIGAAAGLALGTVAELTSRKPEPQVVAVQTAAQPVQVVQNNAVEEAKPQTPAPRYEITSKPCPTSTYTWTPRPQIADAPRVPDAPTF
ncbi:MAG TPA: glycine zipper family protein [Verrucomicrobiae bacterium]|nr:glycine zipper family protein [Verrucomicrobiae bacterium]